MKNPLLMSILAALSTMGCVSKEAEMCITVDADLETCPAASEVDPAEMYSLSECDLEATKVTGEGSLESLAWVGGDTADPENAACCYPVQARDTKPGSDCVVGRPYIDGEAIATAPLRPDDSWCAAPSSGDGEQDAEAAACWRRLGQLEHASVAAFAKLTLELMAAGAPPALLQAAQRAGLDEIDHAQRCFSIAARLSGEAQSPGQMVFSAPLRPTGDLVALACAAAAEGCLGETLSAAMAADAAARTTDPRLRAELAQIAADETRHAALSWQIVAWAIQAGGAPVRAAVATVLSRPVAMAPMAGSDGLEARGLLGPAATHATCQRAWTSVITPARAVLLAA